MLNNSDYIIKRVLPEIQIRPAQNSLNDKKCIPSDNENNNNSNDMRIIRKRANSAFVFIQIAYTHLTYIYYLIHLFSLRSMVKVFLISNFLPFDVRAGRYMYILHTKWMKWNNKSFLRTRKTTPPTIRIFIQRTEIKNLKLLEWFKVFLSIFIYIWMRGQQILI